ncbi:MAG: hypothetical protein LBH94_05610 [Deltaproteobacteria bacterium]|jgi:hypothetical protein|nr:hypothetical protein [Deltaproteobacteria bacterium]
MREEFSGNVRRCTGADDGCSGACTPKKTSPENARRRYAKTNTACWNGSWRRALSSEKGLTRGKKPQAFAAEVGACSMGFFSRLFGSEQVNECLSALIATYVWDKMTDKHKEMIVSTINSELLRQRYPDSFEKIMQDKAVASWGLMADAMLESNIKAPAGFSWYYIENPFALMTYTGTAWEKAAECRTLSRPSQSL